MRDTAGGERGQGEIMVFSFNFLCWRLLGYNVLARGNTRACLVGPEEGA
jgi:hypothetical protein